MLSWRPIQIAAAILGILGASDPACTGATTNELSRVVSASGQIHVFCKDPKLSAVLATFCDDIRQRWLKELGDDHGGWKSPICVVMRQRPTGGFVPLPGEEAPLRCFGVTVGGVLRWQIEAETPPAVDTDRFVHALVGTFCTEVANRSLSDVKPGQNTARVPLWVVTALCQRLDANSRPITVTEIRRALEQGVIPDFRQVTGVEHVLTAAEGGDLYTVQCRLLWEALTHQTDGPEKLRQFLTRLKPDTDWRMTFREVFGEAFADTKIVEKWWALVMARAASMIVAETYTAQLSQEKLMEALQIAVPVDPASGASWQNIPLDNILIYSKDPRMLEAVTVMSEARLQMLGRVAHPVYRPVAQGYLTALNALHRHNLRLFQTALDHAIQTRQQADQRATAISSYIGSMEASLFPGDLANRFGSWFRLGGSEEEKSAQTPVRNYLDRVESNIREEPR